MSTDLVGLDEASAMSERSPSTLRRWLRAGKLTRHQGPPREQGGSPQVFIDRNELLAVLAVSGQQPKQSTDAQSQPSEVESAVAAPVQPDVHVEAELRIARLEGELQAEQLRGQLLARERELLAKDKELEAGHREVMLSRHAYEDMRRDRDDWRDRHDRLLAEQKALRSALQEREGLPWWRKLIGTSSRPHVLPEGIPEAK